MKIIRSIIDVMKKFTQKSGKFLQQATTQHSLLTKLNHTSKTRFQVKTYNMDKPAPGISFNKALFLSNELGNEAIVRRWK